MGKPVALAVLMGVTVISPPAPPEALVTPVFWKGQQAPAFMVECKNASGASRSRLEYFRRTAALRLDGELIGELGPDEPGGIVGGPVLKGSSFTRLVVLGEGLNPYPLQSGFGSYSVMPYDVQVSEGQHSIAFRCWTDWSPEIQFGWARSKRLPAAEQADAPVEAQS
jgi:hypothetical protein